MMLAELRVIDIEDGGKEGREEIKGRNKEKEGRRKEEGKGFSSTKS